MTRTVQIKTRPANWSDKSHSSLEEMLENRYRVEAMERDIRVYFGQHSTAYPWWASEESRIEDLRERFVWSVDDEVLARHLLPKFNRVLNEFK